MAGLKDDMTVTRAQAVRLLGMSGRTFDRLVQEGAFAVLTPGAGRTPSTFDAPALVAAYVAHLGRRTSTLDLQAERAALARVQRQKAEMDIAEREGKLVAVEDVEETWIHVLVSIREAVMALAGNAVQSGVVPAEREADGRPVPRGPHGARQPAR